MIIELEVANNLIFEDIYFEQLLFDPIISNDTSEVDNLYIGVTNLLDLSSKGLTIQYKQSEEFGRPRGSITRVSCLVKRFPKQLSIVIALTNKLVEAYYQRILLAYIDSIYLQIPLLLGPFLLLFQLDYYIPFELELERTFKQVSIILVLYL